jgi:hypothetical protein
MGTSTSKMDLFILLSCQGLVYKVFFTTVEITHTKEKSEKGKRIPFLIKKFCGISKVLSNYHQCLWLHFSNTAHGGKHILSEVVCDFNYIEQTFSYLFPALR